MNLKLKLAIVEQFGSQSDAAQALGLQESRISRLVHDRVRPSQRERELFARAFGVARVGVIFRELGMKLEKAEGPPQAA